MKQFQILLLTGVISVILPNQLLAKSSKLKTPLSSLHSNFSHLFSADVNSGNKPDTVQKNAQKGEPFDGIDASWQNGSDRRTENIWKKLPYFTPNILLDINYTHSFNNPNDNTVVGSTALTRNNEIQLSALHFGGDISYQNARARIMTQFGTRSQVVPRNDYSPYKGQYQLANVYRYLSEAFAGYHINKWYGINIDAGLFMSYIGLNSFYQAENWEYQASFTSDNTP